MPGELRKQELIGDIHVVSHTVDDSRAGLRADVFLKEKYPRKSRAEIQRCIDSGRILLQGRRLKPSTALLTGEVLRVLSPRRTSSEPAVDLAYRILYEDDDLIAVDKPGNLPVHPAGRFLFHTLVMALRRDRAAWLAPDEGRDFFLVHRLDRETSGALVLGKRRDAAAELIRQFHDRETEKRYYAVARGEILDDAFSAHSDIGPARGSAIRLKMQAYPEGTRELHPGCGIQSARTEFRVVQRVPARGAGVGAVAVKGSGAMTLLDCRLETGRQHQIRVHLAHAGHPVVGDKLYGGREDLFLEYIESGGVFTEEMRSALGFERHALHSRSLRFRHPRGGRWVEVESPLPEDMARLVGLEPAMSEI